MVDSRRLFSDPFIPQRMAVETHSVAGIVAGRNPLHYETLLPYTLFLFQLVLIITLCQLINIPLQKIRQPRVIGEVIVGILLGPLVMGRIPNFTATCFPTALVPGLTLVANFGIILFLFIIGLEVDAGFIKRHMRVALTVGLVNMAVPFALGCAVAKGLYDNYAVPDHDEPIKFTTYMVFIAVALCITAFPVLARILTELNLLQDRVGTIVLAAGITNDLLGWILLALSVTLANAAKPVQVVYILLLTFGWFLLLVFPVRLALRWWMARFTHDLERGPLPVLICVILLMVFVLSFYTDIIGVHPIFGAFMVGVIVPRDNGFVVQLTEKIEDLVVVVLIPVYFALAGLNTNLGLLNKGLDWGYIVAIICIAMFGKIAGGFMGAKLNGMLWRELLSVGVLMLCKGIVEIVVLSTGLRAGIISARVFSMFIVMTLITTFLTTPLTLWLYPEWYRVKVQRFLRGEIDWDGQSVLHVPESGAEADNDSKTAPTLAGSDIATRVLHLRFSKVVLVLESLENVTSFMQLLPRLTFGPARGESHDGGHAVLQVANAPNEWDIHAVHLKEFTERTSHLIQALSAEQWAAGQLMVRAGDALLDVLQIFANLNLVHYLAQVLLSTAKHRAQTVCDSVGGAQGLLLVTGAAEKVVGEAAAAAAGDSLAAGFYKSLFEFASSPVGLLLHSTAKPAVEEEEEPAVDDDAKSMTLARRGSCVVSYSMHHDSSISAFYLVVDGDSRMSRHDVLALHLFLRVAGPFGGSNAAALCVFVVGSAGASAPGGGDDLVAVLSSAGVPVARVASVEAAVDQSMLGARANQLFVAANAREAGASAVFVGVAAEVVRHAGSAGANVLVLQS